MCETFKRSAIVLGVWFARIQAIPLFGHENTLVTAPAEGNACPGAWAQFPFSSAAFHLPDSVG
jgi:hypothetical protein